MHIGFIVKEGETWKELRRFSIRQLKDLGLGSKSLESAMEEEVRELMGQLRSKVGVAFSTHGFFNIPVVNVLWEIISGERFNHDDPNANKLIDGIVRLLSHCYSN